MRWLLILLFGMTLQAEQWVVIGHGVLQEERLTAVQVKAIFLGEKHYVESIRLVPLNLPAEDPLRAKFETKILGLSRTQIHAYWIKQHYLGKRPPKVMASIEASIRYVEMVEGAVAYVPLSAIGKHHVYVWYLP